MFVRSVSRQNTILPGTCGSTFERIKEVVTKLNLKKSPPVPDELQPRITKELMERIT